MPHACQSLAVAQVPLVRQEEQEEEEYAQALNTPTSPVATSASRRRVSRQVSPGPGQETRQTRPRARRPHMDTYVLYKCTAGGTHPRSHTYARRAPTRRGCGLGGWAVRFSPARHDACLPRALDGRST